MEQENRVQQIRTRWAEIRALVENFIDSFAQPGPGAQEVNDQQQLQVVHPQQQEADAPGADQWDEAVGEEQYEEDQFELQQADFREIVTWARGGCGRVVGGDWARCGRLHRESQ